MAYSTQENWSPYVDTKAWHDLLSMLLLCPHFLFLFLSFHLCACRPPEWAQQFIHACLRTFRFVASAHNGFSLNRHDYTFFLFFTTQKSPLWSFLCSLICHFHCINTCKFSGCLIFSIACTTFYVYFSVFYCLSVSLKYSEMGGSLQMAIWKKCLTFFIGSFGIFLCLAIQLLLISLHGYVNCIRLNFCNEIYLAQTLNFIFFVFCETFGYIYLVQDILKHDYVLIS